MMTTQVMHVQSWLIRLFLTDTRLQLVRSSVRRFNVQDALWLAGVLFMYPLHIIVQKPIVNKTKKEVCKCSMYTDTSWMHMHPSELEEW